MGQRALDGTDLSKLRRRYRRLTTEALPRAATERDDWPVDRDHCFARIVLDDVFGDVWYDHVDGRPAYEALSEAELREAIDIADRMLVDGRSAVAELNENSLRWRGEAD